MDADGKVQLVEHSQNWRVPAKGDPSHHKYPHLTMGFRQAGILATVGFFLGIDF